MLGDRAFNTGREVHEHDSRRLQHDAKLAATRLSPTQGQLTSTRERVPFTHGKFWTTNLSMHGRRSARTRLSQEPLAVFLVAQVRVEVGHVEPGAVRDARIPRHPGPVAHAHGWLRQRAGARRITIIVAAALRAVPAISPVAPPDGIPRLIRPLTVVESPGPIGGSGPITAQSSCWERQPRVRAVHAVAGHLPPAHGQEHT